MYFTSLAELPAVQEAPTLGYALNKALIFLLSVSSTIAIISLVVAGIIYLKAGGDSSQMEVAKRAVYFSIIGVAMVLSGIVIVKTLSTLAGN